MNGRERGFLLLSSNLGDPKRRPLTTAQLRNLAASVAAMEKPQEERALTEADLVTLGYKREMAGKICFLLDEEQRLDWYLNQGKRRNCIPLTRVSPGYPVNLRQRLGLDSPGVLWTKGDVSILERPRIALVGSRDIGQENAEFAARVGREAARQGYALVSGNARGADRIAQSACLNAGGCVISVVADALEKQSERENVLYISEDSFDLPFSTARALSRNRVIHALGEKTFVAQCSLCKGGTWSGTVSNLREHWSPVFAFRDGSEAMGQLENMGATLIDWEDLADLSGLRDPSPGFLE